MSKNAKLISDLYCRMGCYSTTIYKNIINTCSCHPNCKILNTYHNYNLRKNIKQSTIFLIGDDAKSCDCKKKCKVLDMSI